MRSKLTNGQITQILQEQGPEADTEVISRRLGMSMDTRSFGGGRGIDGRKSLMIVD